MLKRRVFIKVDARAARGDRSRLRRRGAGGGSASSAAPREKNGLGAKGRDQADSWSFWMCTGNAIEDRGKLARKGRLGRIDAEFAVRRARTRSHKPGVGP